MDTDYFLGGVFRFWYKKGVGVKSVNINAESFVFIPFSRV